MLLPLMVSLGSLLPKIKAVDPHGPHTGSSLSPNLRPALSQSIAFYLLQVRRKLLLLMQISKTSMYEEEKKKTLFPVKA